MGRKTKIVHLADTHIRNQKYHDDYRIVFREIYEKIAKIQPDFIVHCGDLAHTKTQISPEYVDLCAEFLKNLANLSPTYVIPGNHDGNLKNLDRMDAITPIVDSMKQERLYYSRNSMVWRPNENINLFCWSLFDENWPKPTESDKHKVNICLYHGPLEGVKTDVGYVIQESGGVTIEQFSCFDYVMLGDIHKSNQVVDMNSRVRYVGSTIQQNFGETDDKGFLLWTIDDKNIFEVEHFVVKHPHPFVNITVSKKIPLEFYVSDIPEKSKIKITSNEPYSLEEIKKTTDYLSNRLRPEFITFVNSKNKPISNIEIEKTGQILHNIKDIDVQSNLLLDFAKTYSKNPQILSKIVEINRKYEENMQEIEARNVCWKILEMEWSNLYNYGEGNFINFQNLNGIVGIFGQNYSGKSSIFDALLLCLFNSDTKPPRKNVYYINENKDNAFVRVKMMIGDKIVEISRKFTKYFKNLKGNKSFEARVDVSFVVKDVFGNIELVGDEGRSSIDAQIQEYIGTIENFLITSMSSQFNSSLFIDLGSTKRKQMLASFLDLDSFDKKFQQSKEEKRLIDGEIRSHKGNYLFEIDKKRREILNNATNIEAQTEICKKLKEEMANAQRDEQIFIFEHKEEKVQMQDVGVLKKELAQAERSRDGNIKKQKDLESQIREKEEFAKTIQDLLETIDLEEMDENKKKISELKKEIDKLKLELREEKSKEKNNEKKICLLKEVPCGDLFSQCRFIKDAHEAKEEVERNKLNIQHIEKNLEALKLELAKPEMENAEKYIAIYQEYHTKKLSNDNQMLKFHSEFDKLSHVLDSDTKKIEKLKKMVGECEQNREKYEESKKIQERKAELGKRIQDLVRLLAKEELCYTNLFVERGKLEQELETLLKNHEHYEKLLVECTAIDIFSKACHPNGIPYDITKSCLEVINEEINKILNKVVNFRISLETFDDKMNVFIQHPSYNVRPIEGASGSEKAFASLAIRLALLKVSNLPRSNVFILDEPGTSFDENNIETFSKMLEVIKTDFDSVFLISHMDSLKDVSDVVVEIETDNGFAKIVI